NRIYPDFHQCSNPKLSKSFEQKGQFWVINNYIKASKDFNCDETITYTTHGEYYFLDNLVFLTERWQGPISVAVYAPGTDFDEAVKTIIHLRNCVSQNVKDFVTFHLYFESQHFPTNFAKINCNERNSFHEPETSYRKTKGLLYPVNVGRNIARTNAATYFVFASDIELYPSINVIPEFLKMIKKSDYTDSLNKRVFVLPIFEVKKDQKVPEKKNELLSMLSKKDAILFHANICKWCHLPPGSE
ncbi:Beta-1,4-glucuronyltransferase 1, partial [Armadillidium vulgare]